MQDSIDSRFDTFIRYNIITRITLTSYDLPIA